MCCAGALARARRLLLLPASIFARASPRSLPLVRGDERKLSQVFSNLLSNAVKFTPKGGEVIVEALEQGDGGVLISIRDTGVGMTADETEVALEPFGQVNGGRDRWREGTGARTADCRKHSWSCTAASLSSPASRARART